jgi:hypothetical protein
MIIARPVLGDLRARHDRFLADQERMLGDALDGAGDDAEEHVDRSPGFKPGPNRELQSATTHRVVRRRGGGVLLIRNDKPYAAPIDKGARPHEIVARRGKTLAFVGRDGSTVFRRRVRHPGNRPYEFLSRATDHAFTTLRGRLERGMRAIAKRF